MLPTVGEVLPGIVNDMVSTDRANQIRFRCAAHARDLCSERLGDLHRERPDTSPRPDDQDLLRGLDLSRVAKTMESGDSGVGDGRRLLAPRYGRRPL